MIHKILRGLLLLPLPLLAAYGAYTWFQNRDIPPIARVAHPPVPAPYQSLTNPLHNPSEETVKEGRVLYEKNCSHCHGVSGAGNGPMARAFRLRPTNFIDKSSLATWPESYLFWRIKEGGPGLPPESTPWDSAMPAWGDALGDDEIWKIILGLYDVTGVSRVRSPESGVRRLIPLGTAVGLRGAADYSDAYLKKVKVGDSPEVQKLGQTVYQKRCSFCHGDRGAGDGPLADYLYPRPRNLRRGLYKLRSTTELPTDEDIYRTLSLGISGTSMPAWGEGDGALPERERWAAVHYIKTFYPDFKDPSYDPYKNLFVPGAKPADSSAWRRHGAALFLDETKGACVKCHGAQGRGDGRESGTHKDDFGFPILPANFTKSWRLKNWGHSPESVYRSVSLGLQGTPMPSYREAFHPEDKQADEKDRWSLAYFIYSLTEKDRSGHARLRSKYLAGDLPADPHDARWYAGSVPELGVPLGGQILVAPRLLNHSVDYVTVRSLHNERAIAFLLQWEDRFKNVTHTEAPAPAPDARPDTYIKVAYDKLAQSYSRSREGAPEGLFRDAAALQFPVRAGAGQAPPYFFLGQPGEPVNLWWWKADWQEHAAAHNGTGVEEINAAGFDQPAIPQPADSQAVRSAARYDNGRWSVVMMRSLATHDPAHDVQFRIGDRVPIAFHVWDGANQEDGLRRAISSWFYLELEPPVVVAAYGYALAGFVLVLAAELLILRWARAVALKHVVAPREPV